MALRTEPDAGSTANCIARSNKPPLGTFSVVPVIPIAIYAVVIVCAAGCLYGALREARGRSMRLWRLFATPLLALAIASVLLLFPATWPHPLLLWGAAFAIGLAVGAMRGPFINFQVDHEWHMIRLKYARDGRAVAVALTAMGALEIASSLAAPAGSPYHPILAAGTAACAGFLMGRAVTVGMRARRESHSEFRTYARRPPLQTG